MNCPRLSYAKKKKLTEIFQNNATIVLALPSGSFTETILAHYLAWDGLRDIRSCVRCQLISRESLAVLTTFVTNKSCLCQCLGLKSHDIMSWILSKQLRAFLTSNAINCDQDNIAEMWDTSFREDLAWKATRNTTGGVNEKKNPSEFPRTKRAKTLAF